MCADRIPGTDRDHRLRTRDSPVTVLLVDDHAVVRAGYRRLLEDTDDIRVVAEAADARAASEAYLDFKPDLVIMDLSLPGVNGLDAIRRIVAHEPRASILVFSMHEETVFAERALQAGARGYITKSSAPEVLVEAVRQLMLGRTYLGPDIVRSLAVQQANGSVTLFDTLSPREFEVFRLLAEGQTVNDIAQCLCLSQKTVANYSTQVKLKLQVQSNAELARIAIRHGVIHP